jgi:hypothetical protein
MAVLPLLIAGLGCGGLIPGNVDLFEGDNAAKAAAAIKSTAGMDNLNVIRAEVRPDVMKITVQSPKNPKEQDEYTYERGSVTGPEPVRIDNIFANVVPSTTEIDEIDFAAIPATIKRAVELADAEGAKVTLISMDSQYAYVAKPELKDKGGAQTWALTWRIFIEGTRISKYFWADKQGKLNEQAY